MSQLISQTMDAQGDLARLKQAILDEGNIGGGAQGEVILRGEFYFGSETVTVNNPVNPITIRGDLSKGTKPIIHDGGGGLDSNGLPKGALSINAPGLSVIIRDLRFEKSSAFALQVTAVKDLTIDHCTIIGVQPVQVTVKGQTFNTATGITVGTPDEMVIPRATSGNLTITNNEIDIGADASNRTLGILLNNAGMSGQNVVAIINSNTVRNVTAFGVDLRSIIGSATVSENKIMMGLLGTPAPAVPVSGIRCLGSGEYAVRRNEIECGYENATGICLQSNNASVPIAGAVVDANQITMSTQLPLGDRSAGIELRQNCRNNTVLRNGILGRSRYVLAVVKDTILDANKMPLIFTPSGNRLEGNYYPPVGAVVAHVFVTAGVKGTVIMASYPVKGVDELWVGFGGNLIDLGDGTTWTGRYIIGPLAEEM